MSSLQTNFRQKSPQEASRPSFSLSLSPALLFPNGFKDTLASSLPGIRRLLAINVPPFHASLCDRSSGLRCFYHHSRRHTCDATVSNLEELLTDVHKLRNRFSSREFRSNFIFSIGTVEQLIIIEYFII